MTVPGADDAVIFDNNTFDQMTEGSSESESVFTLSQNIEVRSIIASSTNKATLDLNGNSITTFNNLSAAIGNIEFIGEGSIILKDESSSINYITGSQGTYENIDLVIDYDNESVAVIESNLDFNSLTIENGTLEVEGANVALNELSLQNESELTVTTGRITIASGLITSEGAKFSTENATLYFDGETSIEVGSGFQDVSLEVTRGVLSSKSDLSLSDLTLKLGTNVTLSEGTTITVTDNVQAIGSESSRIALNSATGTAAIRVENNTLLCFDFLDVDGVDISGSGAFNVGLNGSVQNAEGWQQKACADVLFADFTIDRICAGAVQSASDVSKGNVTAWRWFVNDVLVSETAIPTFDFPESGSYQIRLEVTDDVGDTDDFVQDLVAGSNTLEENEVLISNGQLVSVKPADTYQWYFNGAALDGATARTYALTDEAGTYFVVTGDGECFRKSEEVEFIVTSTDDDPQLSASYNVYPNPARDLLTIAVESLHRGEVIIELTDMSGRVLVSDNFTKNQFAFEQAIDTSELPNGLYVINVVQGSEKETRLIAVDK